MIHDSGVLLIEANTEAEPATLTSVPVFDAHPLLLDGASTPAITKVDETLLVCNASWRKVQEGDRLAAVKTIQGHYLVLPTGPAAKVFKTPSGGIPGASGGVFGNAVCTMRQLSESGGSVSPTDQLDSSGAAITATVHNMGVDPVGGDVDIQGLLIDGFWVANWEDCSSAA